MTAKKSTRTNKPAAEQAPAQEMDTTTPDQDKATPTLTLSSLQPIQSIN